MDNIRQMILQDGGYISGNKRVHCIFTSNFIQYGVVNSVLLFSVHTIPEKSMSNIVMSVFALFLRVFEIFRNYKNIE